MVDDPIWQALAAMRIEPEGAALGFTRRLARENGWSRSHAEAVFHEYRRFLYLAATGSGEVTPSDQVDQAWHLHLTYTRHYWEELCARIIGRPLHHGPTAGGASEGRKYRALYAETLRRYRETFGQEPPCDIWPPSDLRFGTRYQRVDTRRHFLLPRRMVSIAGMAGGAALLAACTALVARTTGPASDIASGSGWNGFLQSDYGIPVLVVAILALLILVGMLLGRRRASAGSGAGSGAVARRRRRDDSSGDSSGGSFDSWSSAGGNTAAAGGAAFAAGGDFGGGGADASWDDGAGGSDSGGDSGCGGCGGD